jgi:RNA polymerase-associated protein CTR9
LILIHYLCSKYIIPMSPDEFLVPCRYFLWLSHSGDRMRFDLAAAAVEARSCSDLLSQAQYHVARARKIDEQEREVRRRQEEEREALRAKQQAEQEVRLKEQQDKHQQMLEVRKQYKEKTKTLLQFSHVEEKPSRSKGGGGRVSCCFTVFMRGKEILEGRGRP